MDQQATIKQVEHFFKHKLPPVVMKSGHSFEELANPTFTSIITSYPQLKDYPDAVEADNIIHAVHSAIYHCSKISYIILTSLYFEDKRVKDILRLIDYGQLQYYKRFKPDALLEFADEYNKTQKQYGVSQESTLDLHVYN